MSGHIYLRPGSSKPEMYVPTAEVSGTHPEKSVAEGDPGTQAPAPGDGHALPLNSQSPQKTDEGIRADQNVGH